MTDSTENPLYRLTENRHPSTHNVAKWLIANPKLPAHAHTIALEIEEQANRMLQLIEDDSPELTNGLRKLLEAKDSFVRAVLDEQPGFWTDR